MRSAPAAWGEKTTRQGGWQEQMYQSQEGRQMKFAVMGTGEFGGRYGGRLVHAGLDVTFIARGQRYDEIKCNGLHIQPDAQGRRTDIDRVQVTDAPSQVGPVDVVIFAVKNYHVEEAAAQITPLLGDATVVLPVQNGVTAAERLATMVGRQYILGYATTQPHAIGELDGPVSPRVHALCAVLKGAGVNIDAVDNGQIDGDTVSLYFNGKLMISKERLSAKPITLRIRIDPNQDDNDLVMYAENLGSIPPNTSLMVVTVGDKRYEVNITSTDQTSGTVRFKLRE
jgi:hypothetical protein